MNFGDIIDEVHAAAGGDMDEKYDLLKERLEDSSKRDVEDFIALFDKTMDEAYRWDLWAAAYVIGGGCSDDGFIDFRATLISHGRETFEKAKEDPDTLAEYGKMEEDYWFYEGYQYVPTEVAEEMTGETPARYGPPPEAPVGEEWDEHHVDRMYPRLAQLYS